MSIETEFIDNTGMNLVNPFIPVKNYSYNVYMKALIDSLMQYSQSIIVKTTSVVDGDSAKIVVEMSKRG